MCERLARVKPLDDLTYAGSTSTLDDIASEDRDRLVFIRGDIADRDCVDAVFREHRPRAVLNLAAETHDDRSIDETCCVHDGDVVMVPRGYHPVGAAHGYDLYYLNVMAGPERNWIFRNDPAHEWMLRKR